MTQLDFYNSEYRANSSGLPYHISAGGVVYKKVGDIVDYLLLGRDDNGVTTYHLPKGTLHIDETLESCAVREISEESGCKIELKTYLGAKTEQYTYLDGYYDKTLHYYAAEYLGNADMMDAEHDFKEWCSYDEATNKLKTNIKREDIFLERAKNYLDNVSTSV